MSKVIAGGDLSACQRWDAPSMRADRGDTDAVQEPQLPTDEELEQLKESARREGFDIGREQGLAEGREEVRAACQRLTRLMEALARPFEALDRQVEEELVALTNGLVRQLTRREIKTDPGLVIAAVRESLEVLPVASRGVTLHLHPDDAALVREVYAGSNQEPGWAIAENPSLTPGGCRVTTETSQVDNTVERRVATALTRVFGDDRVGYETTGLAAAEAAATSGQAAAGPTAADDVS